MKRFKRKLKREEGSIDFVQLIVGLMIISIASVGTFKALSFGYGRLDYEMRYRKALSIARSQVEYWQGRIHTDPPSNIELAGNLGSPKTFLLDELDPSSGRDDIDCEVAYAKIRAVSLEGGAVDEVSYWEIKVRVSWYEPGTSAEEGDRPDFIWLLGSMVPAAL